MSHVFISYAHADKAHLDRLVAWLGDKKPAEHELWYDQHIEGGNAWREEIATALDEAFAVLVVVTANSVKSLYCTYEWAYALGQGIPILPLVFDEVSITDVPAPLASKQFTNCQENIPGYLREQIHRLKSVPPQIVAVNQLIYEAIYDTHRRFFILGWAGDEVERWDDELMGAVIAYFEKQATEAHHVLQTLMVDKAFVLRGRQYRYCWQITDLLYEFSRLHRKSDSHIQFLYSQQFEDIWLPAFEYFEGSGWWGRWIRCYFERDLEDEHNRTEVLAEMMRAFPMFQTHDVDFLIQRKRITQKHKKD